MVPASRTNQSADRAPDVRQRAPAKTKGAPTGAFLFLKWAAKGARARRSRAAGTEKGQQDSAKRHWAGRAATVFFHWVGAPGGALFLGRGAGPQRCFVAGRVGRGGMTPWWQ